MASAVQMARPERFEPSNQVAIEASSLDWLVVALLVGGSLGASLAFFLYVPVLTILGVGAFTLSAVGGITLGYILGTKVSKKSTRTW